METETTTFSDIQVFNAAWLPFGRSNMEALNRFVGSHKKYTSATEFGVDGCINDMARGSIKMHEHGIFLSPIDYNFTGFLKAKLTQEHASKDDYGLNISKNGLTCLGISLEPQNKLSLDEVKIVCGKLNYNFSNCVMPLLTDVQQSLVASLYEVADAKEAGYKLHSYALVKCKIDDEAADSTAFLEKYSQEVASLTDWVMHHETIDGCHIFVGMAACLCVGETNQNIDCLLQDLLYVNTCQKTAQRLHSILWSCRRQIQLLRDDTQNGSYTLLKQTNEKICVLNDMLSKLKVFDQMLRYETKILSEDFNKARKNNNSPIHQKLATNFEYEIEKSENRSVTLDQLSEEVNGLSSELENRLELIMTKDNMQLNLILLILTVISILGVAEVQGFSKEQWEIVVAFLIPFGIFILFYVRKLMKNYRVKNMNNIYKH